MKALSFLNVRSAPLKALLAFALIVMCCLSFFLVKRISNMADAASQVNHTNVVRLALSETLSRLKDAEAEQRGFLLSKNSFYLTNYTNSKKKVQAQISTLRTLVSDNPAQVKQTDTLQALVNKRIQALEDILSIYGNRSIEGTSFEKDLLPGKRAMQAVKSRLELMQNKEVELLNKRTEINNQYIILTPVYAILLIITSLSIILFTFHKLRTQLKLSHKYLLQSQEAEKEAQKASFLLENAEQIAGIASWGWNFSTNKQEFSKNLYKLFGFETESFGPGVDNFMHLIDDKDRYNLVQKLIEDREKGLGSSVSHFWATCNNGERKYFQCISRFGKNEHGEDIITGTSQDITNEYLLRQEAQQRAKFIEQVVDLNVDMVAAFDTELRVTLWNKAYEEALGVSRKDILGKKLTDVFPYLKDDIKTTYLKAALEGKETIRKEFKFLRNQRHGQISIVNMKNESGDITGVITIIHDISEIKQAETQLKESNIRFEQAEEAGNLGSYYWNMQTNQVAASNNLYKIYGYEPNSIIPTIDFFYGMLHPEDKPGAMEVIRKNLEIGKYSPLYCRIVRKNGEIRFIKATSIPVLNEIGETVLFGSVLDITEEELLKQQLQERNQLVESLVENSADMIEVIDTEMRYTIWNKANEQQFGLSKQEVLGRNILDVFPALREDTRMELIRKGLKGSPVYRKEQSCLKGSKVADFNYIPLHNSEGAIIGLLIMAHDITERIKAEEKLKKANEELHYRNLALKEAYVFNRHITDLAPNGIYVYDKDKGSTVYTNKKMLELHGYSNKEMEEIGSDLLIRLVHPDDLGQLYKTLEKFATATDDTVVELEYRMRTKEGTYRNIMCKESVFKRNSKGDAEQFIGVAIDVTDIREAEKELRERNKELQQTNEELASFNYIASHDLQEPLRKIQTFCNYLEQTETGMTPLGLDNLKRMQMSAARMRALINDLLSFSRIDMVKEEMESVNLNEILKGAKSSLRASLDEKNARVITTDLPVIKGISFQLQQLFENLISNAVKYCTPGKAPVVSIACKKVYPAKDIAENFHPEGAYHLISFSDNGIGFEQQYAVKIFELFQRLHSKNEYPGTGLGLAICKKIVQNHGGYIHANSKLGEGSVFEIYLPVTETM